MKKLITTFMVLFFLIGTGTKSYGQAAGDYVFTQATDNLWATLGNWSISDGAGNLTAATRTPAATDNVWIQATKTMSTIPATSTGTGSIATGSTTVTLTAAPTVNLVGLAIRNKVQNGANYGFATGTYITAVNGTSVTISQPATLTSPSVSLEFYPSCKNLTVNGTFTGSVTFAVFGDVTVNTGGTLTQGSDLYCANINNYGTFNSTSGYRSSKNLYVGYNGAVPGTGDYTIINDGTFGDIAPKVPQGSNSGIIATYSNQANSMTIKTSSSNVTNYAFNIAQLQPTGYIKTTANTTLNIKESMSLLGKSGLELSIQNNDTSANTLRTCNIDHGVTVYIGYNFHANRAVTTNNQGSFVYNVYGTLDLGSYASYSNDATVSSAANTTDFDLCMTTFAGNTSSLTFNLGDGTQANAGTLILGSNVKLIKQAAQTMAVNFNDYSTVDVTGNYGYVMNYQLLNNNTPATYLFPKNFYNLTLNGAGVVLPFVAAIKGTKTYTTTYATTATPNWVANTSALQGSILFTGSNYYYVPVVRALSSYYTGANPLTLVGDTILQYIKPGLVINGSGISNFTVTSLTGNSLTMSAAVGTMNPNVPVSNTVVSFSGGKSDLATAPTGTSTNVYSPVLDGTQYLIYLGGNDFPTASTTILTAINSPNAGSNALVYSIEKNKLVISDTNEGDIASVYNVSGIKVASVTLTGNITTLDIPTGIYLVKINTTVSKVVVR